MTVMLNELLQTKAFFMDPPLNPPALASHHPPEMHSQVSPDASLPDPWVLSANTSSLCRGNVLEHLQMALVKERKEAVQIRTVDLAASSKGLVSFLLHRPGCCLSSRLIRI